MKFTEKKARQIIDAHGLHPKTVKTWRHRSAIPDKYANPEHRVLLTDVLPPDPIDQAIEKYGVELRRKIESLRFKAGQNESYYRMALYSLAANVKRQQKNRT